MLPSPFLSIRSNASLVAAKLAALAALTLAPTALAAVLIVALLALPVRSGRDGRDRVWLLRSEASLTLSSSKSALRLRRVSQPRRTVALASGSVLPSPSEPPGRVRQHHAER